MSLRIAGAWSRGWHGWDCCLSSLLWLSELRSCRTFHDPFWGCPKGIPKSPWLNQYMIWVAKMTGMIWVTRILGHLHFRTWVKIGLFPKTQWIWTDDHHFPTKMAIWGHMSMFRQTHLIADVWSLLVKTCVALFLWFPKLGHWVDQSHDSWRQRIHERLLGLLYVFFSPWFLQISQYPSFRVSREKRDGPVL